MIKFSIIMPCYNLEQIVARTIENVLKQKYHNFELIIIDDGSTDNTLKIIKGYEKKDNRIKVYSKKNGGVSSARNFGIKKVSGEFIMFLDGDDLIKYDLLQNANGVLIKTKADMFSFGYIKTNEKVNRVIKRYSSPKCNNKVFTGMEFQELYFSRKIDQTMCSFIVRRKIVIDNLILFDENTKIGEDQEFQLRCNIKCQNIYYDSREYFSYVQREGSAVNQQIKRDDFNVFLRMEKYLSGNSKKSYYNFLRFVFFSFIKEIAKRGSDQNTVKRLLELDFVLNNYYLERTKNSVLIGLLIIIYKSFYKKHLIRKYKLLNM
jgi:glycosyltransferase involved in cell wall biosynthesis